LTTVKEITDAKRCIYNLPQRAKIEVSFLAETCLGVPYEGIGNGSFARHFSSASSKNK